MTELTDGREGTGYDGAAVLGGVLATIFFPLIALIGALLLQGSQPDPVKRGQLRRWAWLSAGWMAFQAMFVVLIFISMASLHPTP